jgi:hypothetical protein
MSNSIKEQDLYIEKMAWFKQNEKPEAVLVIADNPERVKLVIAWINLDVKPAEVLSELQKDADENEIWEWLWENSVYSKKDLINSLGIPLSELGLESKMKQLIGNHVIYPDGTVNSYVQRYLREQVVKLFDGKAKRPVKKDT